MSQDQFTPEEQAIIDRLRDAPQPRLSQRTIDAIQQKMLVEMTNPALPVSPDTGSTLFTMANFALTAAAAVFIVVIGLVVVGQMRDDADVAAPLPETHIAAQHTNTPTSTATAISTPSPTVTLEDVLPTLTEAPVIAATFTELSPDISTATVETPIVAVSSPVPDASPEPIIVVEGLVQRLDEDTVTIYGIDFEVASGHPMLNLIDVGDTLRIEGVLDERGALIASVIDNLTDAVDAVATVGIEGPVEAIEDNVVTINGVEIELSPDDPVLVSLNIGDFLSVEGDFELREGRYLLVVVHFDVIGSAGDGVPVDCFFEETGMGIGMGRWRCDSGMGMGMGMGSSDDSGMGMGMGMGMGN